MGVFILSRRNYHKKLMRETYEEAYAIKDKDIKAQNTIRVDFYRTYLWRLFLGSVDISLPRNWSDDYFRAVLFLGGCIAVTEVMGSVVPFAYSVRQRNKWKYPITIYACDEVGEIVKSDKTVGENCELIYLESASYGSFFPCGVESLIDVYAQKLANCDGGIDINLLVSRTPWIFGVENDAQATDMKALFTRVMSGSPAVWFKIPSKSNSPIDKIELPLVKTPVKENFIANDVQLTKRSIINEFLTAIGVNNANTDKRERLISGEVESNNIELQCAVNLWQSNIDKCIKKVNELYGDSMLDPISIKFIGGSRNVTSDRFNGNIQNTQQQNQ